MTLYLGLGVYKVYWFFLLKENYITGVFVIPLFGVYKVYLVFLLKGSYITGVFVIPLFGVYKVYWVFLLKRPYITGIFVISNGRYKFQLWLLHNWTSQISRYSSLILALYSGYIRYIESFYWKDPILPEYL